MAENNCQICTGTYVLNGVTGYCGCAPGYQLLDTGACLAYPIVDPCEGKPYTFAHNLTCTDDCQAGTPAYYLDIVDNKCYPCHFSCNSCLAADSCLSCPTNMVLNPATLECDCPGFLMSELVCYLTATECGISYFGNTNTGWCEQCEFGCETCTNA